MGDNKLSRRKRLFTIILKVLMVLSILITVALILWMIIFVLFKGLKDISWHFIVSKPSYINESIGIWPNIVNTIYIVFTTIIVVIPAGTAAAIYLNEYGKNKKLIKIIRFRNIKCYSVNYLRFGWYVNILK